MNDMNKNFAAPHTGIVLAIGELVAPIIFTLASLFVGAAKAFLTVVSYIILPNKKLETVGEPETIAPHVALITVPGNFVTGAFKTW